MKIKEVIVVEGKTDKQFLQSFLDADILTCNGSAIDGFDIDLLKELAKTRGVIILTDPDYPGLKIRNYLEENVKGVKHAFVRKEVSIKHHKVGVAESTKEEVMLALENAISFDENISGTLTMTDLLNLHLIGQDSKNNKEKIENHFHIGHCNSKTLLKRLNMLNVDIASLKEVLDD